MRDDIHRSAPVAQRWRTVLKLCMSAAHHQNERVAAVERAISLDLRDLVTKSGRNLLEQLCESAQTQLFGTKEVLGQYEKLSSVEREAALAIIAGRESGVSCTVDVALSDAFTSHLENNIRNSVRAHVQLKEPIAGSRTVIFRRWDELGIGVIARAKLSAVLAGDASATMYSRAKLSIHDDHVGM